jgi:formylglycine-generating enzyme required for sulfatase activity
MKLNRLLTLCLGLVAAAPCVAQSPCDADLDRDGIVAGSDLAIVLGDWGPCKGCQGDVTRNGVVDGIDLAFVLTLWSAACTPLPWATVIEATPDPAVVTNADLRERIIATGLPWRVRDNGTGIEMLLVPPGTFDMGCSPSNSSGCESNENPVHAVSLTNAFYIGRYEVTQAQWVARVGSNPSGFQSASAEVPASEVPNRPVERVSWNTVQGFLSATGMRLPTEAEWEYAYRAGTTTAFHGWAGQPTGTNDDLLVGQISWFSQNASIQTRPVGRRAANGFGLHDMAGNVWEFVNDWLDPAYYVSSPSTNPLGPTSGTARVLRGGGVLHPASSVRSSHRNGATPDGANPDLGFRVARNP